MHDVDDVERFVQQVINTRRRTLGMFLNEDRRDELHANLLLVTCESNTRFDPVRNSSFSKYA